MAEPVKPKRRYDSPRRRGAGGRPRGASILDAAQRLFVQPGLRERRRWTRSRRGGRRAEDRVRRLRDQERPAPGVVEPAPARRTRTKSPSTQRRGSARSWTSPTPSASCDSTRGTRAWSSARIAALLAVIRDAAPVDPDIGGALEPDPIRLPRQPARHRRVPRREARARSRPRRGPRGRHPVDAQSSRPVAAARRRRGWTPEQFEQWFAETARAQLLRQASPGVSGPGARRP